MGKMKTHKGTAKRVKVTARGKYMHSKSFAQRKLTRKTAKRKRLLRRPKEVSAQDKGRMKKLLPYV